jgi:tripartite-type tricarboxylate transporter receptor subunit TctC
LGASLSGALRIVVGFAAGGPTDIIARLIGQWLSERLGQQFVIENRPGAAGKIATEAVVRAPPDGYTLLQVGSSAAINATLYEKLNYNFIRDIVSVAGIIRAPGVVVVNPTVSAKTIPELIAYAKANPGKITMASPGTGSTPHLAGELFKVMTGVNITLVSYRGDAPAISDLLAGQIQIMIPAPAASIEYIRGGKLRALAVTTSTRWEGLPDIPTVSEFVPGYEAGSWWGVGAPRNTRDEIIEKLNMEINAALTDPKMRARLADLGGTPLVGSPADFGKLIAEETEKWGKVIRAANIKAE